VPSPQRFQFTSSLHVSLALYNLFLLTYFTYLNCAGNVTLLRVHRVLEKSLNFSYLEIFAYSNLTVKNTRNMSPEMLHFYFKIHQNTFGGQASHGPAGGAYSAPPDPLSGLRGER